MQFTVEYDKIKALYTIDMAMNIDGITVTNRQIVTEEMLADSSNIQEYIIHNMMMDAMQLASESFMPKAIKQVDHAIQAAHTEHKFHYGGPVNGVSVKYGDTLTNITDPGEMVWDAESTNGSYVINTLNQFVDLNQYVNISDEILKESGIDEEAYHRYKDIDLDDAIIFLNDQVHWSYSQIADWLETLDIDITLNLEGGE